MGRFLNCLVSASVLLLAILTGGCTDLSDFDITPYRVPQAQSGAPYSVQFRAYGGSGKPYDWRLALGSRVPAGLRLKGGNRTALLVGVPQESGTFAFSVEVRDAHSHYFTRAFSLVVSGAPAVTTASLPEATVGANYSATLQSVGGSGPGTWTVESGSLPPGISLASGSPDATLAGTPSSVGDFAFTVRVTGADALFGEAQLTLSVRDPLVITTSSLSAGQLGVSYSQPLGATGGSAPFNWSMQSGALPGGIALAASTTAATQLTGTPSVAGTFLFVVRITDNAARSADRSLTLVVSPSLTIVTTSLPAGTVGAAYAQSVTATGGSGSGYLWSVSAGSLPPGLTLSGTGSPVASLSGAPLSTGSFNFTLQVVDSASNQASRAYSLQVVSSPLLMLPLSLDLGVTGRLYSADVSASGGTGFGYTWSVSSGSLPPGLVLTSGTPGATISGTPATTGTFSFVLQVTDSALNSNSRAGSISVFAPDTIVTVAGNGTAGFSGDNGPAVSAQLSFPHAVVADSQGFVYIADTSNHRVRRVSPGGTITTYAGTGVPSDSGNGGPATAAGLASPLDLALDLAENLLILETGRVRRVNRSTGIISIVAGNPYAPDDGEGGSALNARLYTASNIAMDASGNLFITERDLNRVRRVDASSGIITRYAGTGAFGFSGDGGLATSAELAWPGALTTNSAGDLFICDAINRRVRRVNALTGVIETFAGNGTASPPYDGGPATAAGLNQPHGLRFNAGGELYISDGANRIRLVDTLGNISTRCGTGTAGFAGDGGPAATALINDPYAGWFNASGDFFFVDRNNGRVRRIFAP
jgi:Putative Ig domain/NHL repeat